MTESRTLELRDFQEDKSLGSRQKKYFVGILEKDSNAVLDALGPKGGFVDESGDMFTGDDAKQVLEELFRDGGLQYYDLVLYEGVAFASFRGALEGRACWIETAGGLTEYPIS